LDQRGFARPQLNSGRATKYLSSFGDLRICLSLRNDRLEDDGELVRQSPNDFLAAGRSHTGAEQMAPSSTANALVALGSPAATGSDRVRLRIDFTRATISRGEKGFVT
jgi:hypothetical protein